MQQQAAAAAERERPGAVRAPPLTRAPTNVLRSFHHTSTMAVSLVNTRSVPVLWPDRNTTETNRTRQVIYHIGPTAGSLVVNARPVPVRSPDEKNTHKHTKTQEHKKTQTNKHTRFGSTPRSSSSSPIFISSKSSSPSSEAPAAVMASRSFLKTVGSAAESKSGDRSSPALGSKLGHEGSVAPGWELPVLARRADAGRGDVEVQARR